jgi:Mn2+/Fe2+ NRAMP family transporter
MAMKSVKLEVRVWWDARQRMIKIAGPGLTASTVSNDPGSKR